MVPALQGFDPKGFYHVSWVGLVAIVYNTNKVTAADAPEGLAGPDRPEMEGPDQRSAARTTAAWSACGPSAMEQKYGWDYFKKLNELNPLIGRSIDDAVTVLNSGERLVAPATRQRAPQRRQRQSAGGQLSDLRHACRSLAVGDPQGLPRARTPPSCSWNSWPARNTPRSWPRISSSRCAPTCRRRRAPSRCPK